MLFFAALFGRRKVENEIEKTRRDRASLSYNARMK